MKNFPIFRPNSSSRVYLYFVLISCFRITSANEAIILDTRRALSDLGWTKSQGSEWQEMSSSDATGNDFRMLMVCQIKKPNQNNWMRTHYIPVRGARRIYIEVEFTIRLCEDVPNVATCKETFNLYYYETDHDEATTTFPPWREGAYVKVDTIAADQRFEPGSSNTNFETRDIGPITKNGIYIAIQDTGACVAIMHIRVYYKYCEVTKKNLATFARTTSGNEVTTLVETKGTCARNAVMEGGNRPSLYCNGEGVWAVPSGFCLCRAGHEPNRALTHCTACQIGEYKPNMGNRGCERCPAYSRSKVRGARMCGCMRDYFRTSTDDADQACTVDIVGVSPPTIAVSGVCRRFIPNVSCPSNFVPSSLKGYVDVVTYITTITGTNRLREETTWNDHIPVLRLYSSNQIVFAQTPSKPINLYCDVNNTSVTLNWDRPINDGGRNDLTYRIECSRCQLEFRDCQPCPDHVTYHPPKQKLLVTHVRMEQLAPYAHYMFRVCSSNAITGIAASSGYTLNNCEEVTVETNQAAPSVVRHVRVSDVTNESIFVMWDIPAIANGRIQEYEVYIEATSSNNQKTKKIASQRTNEQKLTMKGLEQNSIYFVKVRARTAAGYGPYSVARQVQTRDNETSDTLKYVDQSQPTVAINVTQLAIAIGGGILLVVIIVVVIITCRKRSKRLRTKMMTNGKHPMFVMTSGQFSRSVSSGHKTYIDPTTYEDPHRAVREFTKEIDSSIVKIEEIIGEGEFGEVCRGRLRLPNKNEHDVAIKTLKVGYSTQQKLDFLGEASIMGQFEHPNVIRLEGVVTKSRPLMIITEYMENGSLDAFLRNHDNQFSVIQMVGILRNIAAGMKYLADMGYIHRDLAARNILVNAQLICKVSDFGMSRVLEEDADATYTTRGGKIPIRWTAPEAITFRKFTSASDVWSYGIVMWEVMSYGERPYWGMSNRDVMNAVETGYRLPAPMDCPQVQHLLMLECWKKDRNQRPKFGQIVSSLDKMMRNPSQLKLKARNERIHQGISPNGAIDLSIDLTADPSNLSHLPVDKINSSIVPPLDSGIVDDMDEEMSMLHSSDVAIETETKYFPLRISPVTDWLDNIGLRHYKEKFMRSGCCSLEQIKQITLSDLTRMEITDEGDQEKLMRSVKEESESLLAHHGGLPTYAESKMMQNNDPT